MHEIFLIKIGKKYLFCAQNLIGFRFTLISGKNSVDSDHLNPSHNNNNHKWPSSCANLLQSSINCINNTDDKLANNNNNKPSNNHVMSLNHNMHHNMHHHHHLSSALSSPFSSLPYLLDPLGNLQKSAASNNLFWTWSNPSESCVHTEIDVKAKKLDLVHNKT